MLRPVLVTPSTVPPVTLDEAKLALGIAVAEDDGTVLPHEDDEEIKRLIQAAVEHYQGWTGVLGVSLVESTWKQPFNDFCQYMRLMVGPVQSIETVRYRNAAGQLSTVGSTSYALRTDAGGRSFARFLDAYSAPSELYEDEAVEIQFKAGWPVVDGKATTPADIKTAIILRVQLHYDDAASDSANVLMQVERELVSKYRLPVF